MVKEGQAGKNARASEGNGVKKKAGHAATMMAHKATRNRHAQHTAEKHRKK